MEPRSFARALRARQTSAEDLLWQQLRGRRLAGSKWRRQAVLGPYTVDFFCLAAKLVVELDGTGHAAQPAYDAARTREIKAQGFAVLRFGNTQARERLDDVLRRIADALRGGIRLKPPPSPEWERADSRGSASRVRVLR